MAEYIPQPIDTKAITLDPGLQELTEKLAENAHDNWSLMRLRDGWRYGPARNDIDKQHPNLVSYDELSEADKDLDRGTAMETIKAILALGYEIKKPG